MIAPSIGERDGRLREDEVRPVAELLGAVPQHLDQVVGPLHEDVDVGSEHGLGRPLERRTGTRQRGRLLGREPVVVVPAERAPLAHVSFSTRSAFSWRNFGHT
jgi:hypothetical protein